MLRVEAINRVLIQQQSGPSSLRVKPDALHLTAACVWLLNGLHARPDDGSAAQSLMRHILPLTDASDPDIHTALFLSRKNSGKGSSHSMPYIPYGSIFLRRVALELDVPQMRFNPHNGSLPSAAFKFIFNASEEEIWCKYDPVGIIHRVVMNMTKQIPTFNPINDEESHKLLDLSAQGHALLSPAIDDSSDSEQGKDVVLVHRNIDARLRKIWRQFALPPPPVSDSSDLEQEHDEELLYQENLYMQN